MNDKYFKKGIRGLGQTKMPEAEKAAMLARLSAYAGIERPVRPSPLYVFFRGPHSVAVGAFVLVVVLTGGVAFAAEGSIPGDILYPVKIKAIEPLRAAIAVSPEAEESWKAEKVERRLAEAEKMAEEGRLDDASVAEVEKRIDEHFESRPAKEEKFREKLEKHKAILENLRPSGDAGQDEKIRKLERKIEEKATKKDKGVKSEKKQK